MRRNIYSWIRRLHLLLGVFFTPLLLFYIVTGWWQTVTSDEEKERVGGWFHSFIVKLSTVHTSSYFPPEAGQHSHLGFKILVVLMCLGLIFSIMLGLILAVSVTKNLRLVLGTAALGIIVPVLLLWLH